MNIVPRPLLYRVGDYTYPPGGTLTRWQENLQLHYVYSGNVFIQVDQERWMQGPGEICLFLPGHKECFLYDTKVPTHHGYCTAAGSILSPQQIELYGNLPHTVKTSPRIRMLTDLGKSLHEEHTAAARNLNNYAAQMIFAEFFYAVGIPADDELELHAALQRALHFIETHYAEPCDLDQLGHIAFTSPTHLIRLFKKHLNITPSRYVWRLRLQRAAEKLIDTEMSLSEITFQCGFTSSDHFSRVFKQNYQMTPSSYRKFKKEGN